MKKKITLDKSFLNGFSYTFVEAKGTYKFNEVHCNFKYDGKPIIIYYLYPKYLLSKKELYIKKAKKFIKTIKENGELAKYIENYIDAKSVKGYKFKTPYGYENITNINEIIERIQFNSIEETPVKTKTVVKKVKTTGKSKKVAIGVTSGIAVVATALAVYFYLRKPGGGDTPTPVVGDNVAITFNAGEGLFDKGDKTSHSKTITVAKNTKWSAVKEKPANPKLDGNTFNWWTVNNQHIDDNYVFNANTTVLANYTTNLITVTISPSGGAFVDDTTAAKSKIVNYGTTWGDLLKQDPKLQIKDGSVPGTSFNTFIANNEAMNSSTKLTQDKLEINATYKAENSTVITFSPGAGKFNDGGAFTEILPQNVKWSTAKAKVQGKTPSLDGHTFSGDYTYESKELTDDYTFTKSTAVVTAKYNANKYTIKANANGGTFDNDKDTKEIIDIEYGKKWGDTGVGDSFAIKTLPSQTKSLFKFKKQGTSSYIDDDTIITGDLELIAEYQKEDQYKLTIDACEGNFGTGAHAISKIVYKNDKWSRYKPGETENPTHKTKTFKFWAIKDDAELSDDYTIESDVRVYAKWDATKVKVTIDPNGGKFISDGSSDPKEVSVDAGSTWASIEENYKIKDGSHSDKNKVFDVYRLNSETGTVATNFTFTDDTKLVASYKNKASVILTADADGGKFPSTSSSAKAVSIITGQTWGDVKNNFLVDGDKPEKEGYEFNNKFCLDKTKPDVVLKDTDVFNKDTIIYACYDVKTVTVKMIVDSNKGSYDTSETTVTCEYGSTWKQLNTYSEGKYKYHVTAKDNYTFLYFKYKTPKVTTPQFIDENHVFTEDTDIEAIFADPPEPGQEKYTIVVDPAGGTFNDDTSTNTPKIVEELEFIAGTAKWPEVKAEIEKKAKSVDIKTVPTGYKDKVYSYKDSTGSLGTLDNSSVIAGSMVITLTYTPDTVNIKLDAKEGGTFGAATSKTLTPNYGTYYDEAASKPDTIKTGYKFAHYVLNGTSTVIDAKHKYTGNETLDAQYYVTLTLNAGEGSIKGAKTIEVDVLQGTTWEDIKNAYSPDPKSSDYKFTNYKIGETVVKDRTPFTAPVTLDANYDLYNPNDFKTDSWEKFSKIVSQGFDAISKNTHETNGYMNEYETNGNTFIGLERSIDINGINHTVRVIGQNVDDYGGENNAALTFEFADTVSTSEYALYEGEYVKWGDSTLRSKLQNDIYKDMPVALLDSETGIKSVKKTTYNVNTKKDDITSDKLFVLSTSEMFGYGDDIKYPDYSALVKNEGNKYSYYEKYSAKKDKMYWLRSADLLVDDGFIWAIDAEGKLGIVNPDTGLHESRSVDFACGVAPCFAI